MADIDDWNEIQNAISEAESPEDLEEARRLIRNLPDTDEDKEDLWEQLFMVEEALS